MDRSVGTCVCVCLQAKKQKAKKNILFDFRNERKIGINWLSGPPVGVIYAVAQNSQHTHPDAGRRVACWTTTANSVCYIKFIDMYKIDVVIDWRKQKPQ